MAAFEWLTTPGHQHPTEIYGDLIDGAMSVILRLLHAGLRRLLLVRDSLPPLLATGRDATSGHRSLCKHSDALDDVPGLVREDEDNTQIKFSWAGTQREGLHPHDMRPQQPSPTTSRLPVALPTLRRPHARRRRRPRRVTCIHDKNNTVTNARIGNRPRHKHFLPPSVALSLLRTMDKVFDDMCWSIIRLPTYILPEDDVIKWP